MEKVVWTLQKARALKIALDKATFNGAGKDGTFIFDGNEYVVAYARYLVQYLMHEFRRRNEN